MFSVILHTRDLFDVLSKVKNRNCSVSLYRGAGAGRPWPNPNNGNMVRYFRKLS